MDKQLAPSVLGRSAFCERKLADEEKKSGYDSRVCSLQSCRNLMEKQTNQGRIGEGRKNFWKFIENQLLSSKRGF